jgi:hypothetical protein
MDVNKTQSLKEKLQQIRSSKSEDEETTEDKFEGLKKLTSIFFKSTIFWLTLNQLAAKFPTYFIEFGYWETVLYTFAAISFVSLFKSKK